MYHVIHILLPSWMIDMHTSHSTVWSIGVLLTCSDPRFAVPEVCCVYIYEISYSEGKNCRISEGKISSPEVRKKNFRKLNLKIPHNFGRSLERKRWAQALSTGPCAPRTQPERAKGGTTFARSGCVRRHRTSIKILKLGSGSG